MSKENDTLQKQLHNMCDEMDSISSDLTKIDISRESIGISFLLTNIADTIRKHFTLHGNLTIENLKENYRNFLNSYEQYRSYYNTLDAAGKASHGPLLQRLSLMVQSYSNPETGALRKLHDLLRATVNERIIYQEDNGAWLQSLSSSYSPAGHAPGVQELAEMSIPGSNPAFVFETLVWLGQKTAMSLEEGIRDDADHTNNIYFTAYSRLMTQLNEASLDDQRVYVRLFNRQEIMNRDRLAAEYDRMYQEALKQQSEDLSQEKAEGRAADAARTALQDTDLFRQAQAFHRMCAGLTGPMAYILHETQNGAPEPSIAQRRSDVAELLDQPVSDPNKGVIRQELDNTLLNDKPNNTLISLQQKLANTQGKVSPTFTAMARMLTDFARENHNDITDEKRYMKRLIACERTAGVYKSHHRNEFTNPRHILAQEIINFCKQQKQVILTRQQKAGVAEVDPQKTGVEKDIDQLVRTARLQKCAATTAINPNIRDENPPMSGIRRFFKGLGHVMANMFTTLANVTIGLPGNALGMVMGTYTYFLKRPVRAMIQGRMQPSALGVVPGEKDVNLQRHFSAAVDPKTHILTDVRRIPLVWEKPIPDDPNQPPTVSFRVGQATPGSAIAENSNHDAGHSHMCIRYSKTDPITGQLQRYECAFGFGCAGTFLSSLNRAAMTQIGYRIPGSITGSVYPYATEKTVEVTPEQLNQLIRFTQTYENGGYNIIERNCTTFLADAAKAMKLEGMDDIFRKSDYTSESISSRLKLSATPILGNLLLAANADRRLLDSANRNDLSYQRLGQKMVGSEQFERETHRTFNMRMKGYLPGPIGQAVRADAYYSLRNSDGYQYSTAKNAVEYVYRNRKTYEAVAEEAEAFGVTGYSSFDEMNNKNPMSATLLGLRSLFKKSMEDWFDTKVAQGKAGNQGAYDQLIGQIREYHDKMTRAMGKCAIEAVNKTAEGQSDLKAAIKGSQLADEYMDAMDHFFAVNFGSDIDSKEYFRQFASMAQEIKKQFNTQYSTLKARYDGRAILTGNTIDKTRDMACIVSDFVAGATVPMTSKPSPRGTRTTVNTSYAEIMAALRVYKDLDSYIKDRSSFSESAMRHAEGSERKELAREKRRLYAVRDMATSLRYMPFKKRFDDSNLNMLFNTLPATAAYDTYNKSSEPVRLLQCMAYEHTFRGVLKSVVPELEQQLTTAKEHIKGKIAIKKALHDKHHELHVQSDAMKARNEDTKEIAAEMEAIRIKSTKDFPVIDSDIRSTRTKFLNTAAEAIGKELQKKLHNLTPVDKEYLRKIQTCIAQRMYAQDRKSNPGTELNLDHYTRKAADEIMDTLASTYGVQTFNTLQKRLDKENHLIGKDLSLNPRKVREQLTTPAFLNEPVQGMTRKDNPRLDKVGQNPLEAPLAQGQPVM